MVSQHYRKKRYNREKFIDECLGGDGKVIDSFVVDKGHVKGKEVHNLTDNGIIVIYNEISGKEVTKLIARPNQIKRYYESSGRKPPTEYEDVLKLAKLHEQLGYNGI